MIDIRTLQDTNKEHYFRLVDLLRENWGHLTGVDFLHFTRRARSGMKDYVAMDSKPLAIIQTVGLRSLKPLKTMNYHFLELFREPEQPRYRLCLDITVAREARGLEKHLLDYAIFQTACFEPSVERFLTYTPEGIETWHLENGAETTTIETISIARPGHYEPSVVILDYSKRLNEYRQKLRELGPLARMIRVEQNS